MVIHSMHQKKAVMRNSARVGSPEFGEEQEEQKNDAL